MQKNMICTFCPQGCDLTVTITDRETVVAGNRCKKGKEYALLEVTAPVRMITTTVRLHGSYFQRLPVISNRPVPKKDLLECLKQLYDLDVSCPVKMGDVLVSNIMNTGADIVAARSAQGQNAFSKSCVPRAISL